MDQVNIAASASVRHRIALLGAVCLALALCAGVRLVQLEGFSVVAIACVVLGATAAALSLSLQRYLARSLQPLQASVSAMKNGDLSRRIDMKSRDEFGAIAASLDDMNANMSALVADIRSEATFVSQASESLAAGTSELAQRTERQAASLEQTSASVQDLSGSVKRAPWSSSRAACTRWPNRAVVACARPSRPCTRSARARSACTTSSA
jgi:methyl-accepting chemotaxis protein